MNQLDRPTTLRTVPPILTSHRDADDRIRREDPGDSCLVGPCIGLRRPITRQIDVAACGACGAVKWSRQEVPMPAFEAVAEVFGAFDLVGTLPAINAPGVEVLLYSAPSVASRKMLEALPAFAWLYAAPGLAISHDRRHLLVSPAEDVSSRLTPA
ncbi:MAG TPA: hypothetical protein VLB67_09985 [Acidimicrobiia bacterium]|nr:hypothetical protein [Acidimicrobiia bacterium]